MQKIKRLAASLLAGLTSAAMLAAPVAAVDNTVVVSPGNLQGWAFVQEIANGSGSLVDGPTEPPMGTGSANLVVDSTGRELLLNNGFAGTRLADITELSYHTYQNGDSTVFAASLQLDVDYDASDENTAWQGRLVYEPYQNGTVIPETWQEWDALAGTWWASGAPGSTICPQSDPCTTEEVLAAFPDSAIRAEVGNVNFKAGGPWAGGFDGYVDAFTIGTVAGSTTFDFEGSEPAPEMPSNKDDCKKGGWEAYGVFKNQGDCVSYVASGNRNQPAYANQSQMRF